MKEKILFLFCYFLKHFNHAVKKVRYIGVQWMPHRAILSSWIPKR